MNSPTAAEADRRCLSTGSPARSPIRCARPAPGLRGFLWRALAFVLVFMALQTGWELGRGSAFERWWLSDLTVRPAVALIDLLTPQAQAVAQGTRIVAPGGGLNVLFGCEGTDVIFLLAAALLVFAMPSRRRHGGLQSDGLRGRLSGLLWGLLWGLVWVLLLNELRIVALFYAFRSDAGLFDLLHSAGAPLLMVALTGLFFHRWLQRGAAAT